MSYLISASKGELIQYFSVLLYLFMVIRTKFGSLGVKITVLWTNIRDVQVFSLKSTQRHYISVYELCICDIIIGGYNIILQQLFVTFIIKRTLNLWIERTVPDKKLISIVGNWNLFRHNNFLGSSCLTSLSFF